MRTVRIGLLAAFLLPLFATIATADIVILKDGTRIEGEVKRNGSSWRITTPDGKIVEVSPDKVKSIELSGANGPAGKPTNAQAASSLGSLRRSVENISDLKQIIDRFTRFIEQYKDTPAAADAQKDLAQWQERVDQGLVKLGSRWVSAAERTEYADKALVVTDRARDLIAHGRVHDGDLLLTQALDFDPQCAPALYLRGVVLMQGHQLVPARKAFEDVANQLADHAPSLNNLAIILWQQNAIMPALVHYEQAMTASPQNKQVLDNVAEAWAATPDEQKKNIVAQRVVREFIEQDTQLQETMAAQGLYRWGSSWVDRPTMEQYRKTESEVNDKIAVARTDAETAEKQMKALDAQISQIDQSIQDIRNDSVRRDPDGHVVRYPYPTAYYDLQNQEAQVKSDRATASGKAAAAREQMKALQAQLPKPKFTGVQKMIGAEGTPLMVLPGHDTATAPSSAPAIAPASQPAEQSAEQSGGQSGPDVPPPPNWPSITPATEPSTQPASPQTASSQPASTQSASTQPASSR